MDKKAKNTMIVSVIALVLILVGVSYAYFSARITGLESASTISLTAGRMGIVYSEGNEEVTFTNIYPREEAWATKTFTLTGYNTTDQKMNYEIGLNVTTNTFTDGYLTYDLTLVSGTNGTPVASKTGVVINGTGKISFGMGSFLAADGDAHNYELKIYFKDNGLDQNDAQEAVFNAKIYVEESDGILAPDGWKNAPVGSLLAGIKLNQAKPNLDTDTGMTVPGRQITAQSGDYTSEGLRSTEDDYGTSYYYRGAVDNNYLVFANMCWRIVRIDGLGNTKITLYNYNPTSAANPCDASLDGEKVALARYDETEYGQAGLSFFNENDDNKNTYIGYMYSNNPDSTDFNTAHANDVDSTILTNLKSWYDAVFSQTDKDKLADVIWCNDKRVVSDTTYNPRNYNNILGTGLGTDKTYYQATRRLVPTSEAVPSLKCGESKTDNLISKFTASTATDGGYGNGKLNGYKIGLLTADEIAFAGAMAQTGNSTYYLYKNASNGSDWYWSLSPDAFDGLSANSWLVKDDGGIDYLSVNHGLMVRPTVSLKSVVSISNGPGTQSNPFIVS